MTESTPASTGSRPRIEVIIPVHDAARPLARALASVRAGGLPSDAVAITVVCHNLSVSELTATLSEADRAGVEFLSCNDGLNTPAGPRRLAFERSRADYASFLDSDDWFEPGALAEWLRLADEQLATGTAPAAVIAPERHAAGQIVLNPPLRPLGSGRHLDARKDRLAYRSAVRGLYSVPVARALGIDFGTAPGNGSDLAFSLGYWYSGWPLVFASRTPAYILGDDGVARVTRSPRPLSAELAACTLILEGEWFARRAARDRQLIATKFVRVHALPGLVMRADGADDEELATVCADAQEFLRLCGRVAAGFERSLSIRDAGLVRELTRSTLDLDAIRALFPLRKRRTPLSVAFAARVVDQFRIDAPWRWVAGMVFLRSRFRAPAPRPR